jgi:hypothetical protein
MLLKFDRKTLISDFKLFGKKRFVKKTESAFSDF